MLGFQRDETTPDVNPANESERRRRAEELFQAAVHVPPAARGVFLDERCEDPEVRAEVEKLLEIDARPGGVLTREGSTLENSERASAGGESALGSTEFAPDTVVGKRYRIVRLLGRGGMGEVYLANDDHLERPIALKFLAAALCRDHEKRERFLKEARAVSSLNHPSICVVHEVGEHSAGGEDSRPRPYIAMEYIDGTDLERHATAAADRDAPLKIEAIVDIAVQVTDALDAAHANGIVHRDIKPANITINDRGQVKVLDFGLAKRLTDRDEAPAEAMAQTAPGTVLGTPAYMSPEQAMGQAVDPRSDLFSLGALLYRLIAGREPFQGGHFGDVLNKVIHEPPAALARFNYDVPQELDRITRKCLEKNPEQRYQAARELIVDLKNLRRDLQGAAHAGGAETTQAHSVVAVAPPEVSLPSPEVIQDSDVFISYAPVDDQPLSVERQGWISQFHRNLEVRVEQLSGERVKIWRYPGPAETAQMAPAVLDNLSNVKTLVSVVSPPFVKSSGCVRQVESFADAAEKQGNLRLSSGSRIFKVVKRPVPDDEMPPRLADLFAALLQFDFFDVDADTGRIREYDDSFGQVALQRYHERVYDLAQEICHVLRSIADSGGDLSAAAGSERRTVYLATTTSDLEPQRDRIRRELIARGHVVLPDRPLPLVESELRSAVEAAMSQSDYSVHPIGSMYGVVPEGSDSSILEVQNRVASEYVEKNNNVQRVIWIPRGAESRDQRQAAWIEALRRNPAEHRGAEILEDSLENVKALLLDWLQPKAPPKKEDATADAGPPRVYVLCDQKDLGAIETLEDFLFDQGLEVSLPDFDSDEAEAAETHRQNLVDCDGVLVYYGAGRSAWVDIKLRGLLKAAGYGRQRELDLKAVYLAPPFDRRKERYRTHMAKVIQQPATFDGTVLAEFVESIKQAGGRD